METDLASRVYNFIFDSKGGEIELLDLIQYHSPMKGFTEARATEILSSAEQEDTETKQKKKTFAVGVNSKGRKTVRISCRAKICFTYVSNGRCLQGRNCRNLHICQGFLEENCFDENTCRRSHKLLSEENKSKLQRLDYRIVGKQNSKIRSLISKNLPCVCKDYLNKQCGNELCQNLHICSRYVRNACSSEEDGCPSQLSHDLNSLHNKKIFKKYQVPDNYLKCNTLLPRGTKIELFSSGERGRRSKATSLNNLDTDDGSEQHAVKPKFMGFTQNISLGKKGCHCLGPSGDEGSQNDSTQYKNTEETNWGLRDAQPIPILATPSLHPEKSNLLKWVSVGCFEQAPLSLPMRASAGKNTLRPSVSVPRGLGGKKAPTKVGMASGVSNACAQAKPVNWAGRGRGRPLQSSSLSTQGTPASQKLQSTSTENYPQTLECIIEQETRKIFRIGDQSEIARIIFNCILTKSNGTAKFSDISSSKDPVLLFSSNEEKDKWFRKHKSRFLLIENDQGNIAKVKTISSKAKICQNYLGRSAYCGSKRCPYFHICKDYIANGKCSKPGNCNRNHGFHEGHNKKLASALFPDVELIEEQLRQLIKSSTPQVCMEYNKRKCLGSGLRCKKIHVCKNYVSGRCNGNCQLLHERGLRTPATKEILAWLEVRENMNAKELSRILLICNDDKTYDGSLDNDDDVDVIAGDGIEVWEAVKVVDCQCVDNYDDGNDAEDAEAWVEPIDVEGCSSVDAYHINMSSIENHICMKFFLKQCTEEGSCADHHCPMPYQWVYMADTQWHMLNENENINLERFFCDTNLEDNQLVHLSLNCSSFSGPEATPQRRLHVNFSRMELQASNTIFSLKRLSTESEAHVPGCPLATRWRWLVKGPDGKLRECKQQSQVNPSVSVQVSHQKSKDKISYAIEKQYLEGHSSYDYEMEGQRRRIYFRETPMYQRTVHPSSASTREEVERRPEFISQEDFETIRSKPCALPEADPRQLPLTWNKMAECQDHLLVQLLSNSEEYQEMKSLFLTHMCDKLVTISSIDKVQNPFLWEKYTRKKNHMKKMAATKNIPQHTEDERLLFHATTRRNIRRICKQNFDWRLYGEGAPKIYGEGVYFLKDPSLCHWFCPGDDEDGSRYIFIFKVLVGAYTDGKKCYRHPPSRDPWDSNSDMFDSCVDRVGDPQVFVVFDVDQYYPGYLVEYRTRDSLAADLKTCSVQ